MKKNFDITKVSRIVGIIAVVILFVAAYLPWAHIYQGGSMKATLTGMNTISSSYKPALLTLIFSVLFILTVFIYKLWVKIAGVLFGVVVIAWGVNVYSSFYSHATQMYSPTRFTQYSSDTAFGLYIFLAASLLVLVASLTPYYPEKYRKG